MIKNIIFDLGNVIVQNPNIIRESLIYFEKFCKRLELSIYTWYNTNVRKNKKEVFMIDNENGDIIIYQTDDGLTKIDVKVENETVWLSQQQMAELFSTSRTNIIEHINNIYLEEELDKRSTCQNFRQVQKEGNRNVSREIPFYNLDMIISLGYRIKSKVATNNFRKWATER